jgi:hypothetical protein
MTASKISDRGIKIMVRTIKQHSKDARVLFLIIFWIHLNTGYMNAAVTADNTMSTRNDWIMMRNIIMNATKAYNNEYRVFLFLLKKFLFISILLV